MSLQSREELETNLKEYKGQLAQVEELLLMDGENVNEELNDMYKGLAEVIQLTEELLKEALELEAESGAAAPAPAATTAAFAGAADAAPSTSGGAATGTSTASALPLPPNVPTILPASVADQIRRAQVRAALIGQAPIAWAVGAQVQAVYSADGQWYNAVVEGVAENGTSLIIAYEGYAEREEVALTGVRERPEVAEVYTGVAAPKRKRVEDTPVVTEIPKWLEIKPGDDPKTVDRKKKLLKSYKSKIRFQNMDLKTKAKQDNWQSFITGKGTKKKAGFFTGAKKNSIFSVGDGIGAKVGVTGSGKGMTTYQKVKKLDGMQGADEDA